jgi:hypothetical protein
MSTLQEKLFGNGRALQVNQQLHTLPTTLPHKSKTKKARLASGEPPAEEAG